MSRLAGAALLLVLSLGSLAAAAPAQTQPPGSAYASQEGATYFFAYGPLGSGHASDGIGYAGTPLLNFDGCGFMQLRPAFNNGRAIMEGQVDGGSDLHVEIDALHGPTPALESGLATNLTLDGTTEDGHPSHPAEFAEAAVWGTAHAYFLDGSGGRLADFVDPVGGGKDLLASMDATRDGYRDPATQAVKDAKGHLFDPSANVPGANSGEPEVHLRLRSPPDARPTPASVTYSSTGTIPDGGNGLIAPSDRYNATYPVFNLRFGGKATVHMAATALAPPGSNQLRFTWYSPTGDNLGARTLEPAVGSDASADLDFPLSQFGSYHLAVSGKASLARYSFTVDMAPAPRFDLDFWWHNATFGPHATSGLSDCLQKLDQRSIAGGVLAGTRVQRAKPPGFPVGLVAAAVVGASATVMMLVKLITEAASAAALKRQMK